MSEPQHIIVFEITRILNERVLTCDGKRCWACRNTYPGCKTPQREKDRQLFNRKISGLNLTYTLSLFNNRADLLDRKSVV